MRDEASCCHPLPVPQVRSPLVLLEAVELHEPVQTKKARQNQEPLPVDPLHQQLRSDKSCADVLPTERRWCRRPLGDALLSWANCLPSWPTSAQARSHCTAQAQPTKHKGDHGLLDGVNLIRNHVEQPAHATPQTLIVCCGKRG